jgi:hypothetical protein
MPYIPPTKGRAWCDECNADIALADVRFNKFGAAIKPVLCPQCNDERRKIDYGISDAIPVAEPGSQEVRDLLEEFG